MGNILVVCCVNDRQYQHDGEPETIGELLARDSVTSNTKHVPKSLNFDPNNEEQMTM